MILVICVCVNFFYALTTKVEDLLELKHYIYHDIFCDVMSCFPSYHLHLILSFKVCICDRVFSPIISLKKILSKNNNYA